MLHSKCSAQLIALGIMLFFSGCFPTSAQPVTKESGAPKAAVRNTRYLQKIPFEFYLNSLIFLQARINDELCLRCHGGSNLRVWLEIELQRFSVACSGTAGLRAWYSLATVRERLNTQAKNCCKLVGSQF